MDPHQVKAGFTITLILFAWRDQKYLNVYMSMLPWAQQNWEVDLGYCTSMRGIKGHEHVTFLNNIRSIDLQKQYSNIKKIIISYTKENKKTKRCHFVRGINYYKTKKSYVKSRFPNMDPRQVKARFTITPILFAWRDQQYSNGNMSMVPQAQQNWEVDLGYCTSISGIKGHEHVTFLNNIRSIDLQKQYSNIKQNIISKTNK